MATKKSVPIKNQKSAGFDYLRKFLECDGISGFEQPIASLFSDEVRQHGAEVMRDGLGSVIAKVGKQGPKLLIAAHMDEVGFVVQSIEKSGFIRVSPVGGIWTHVVLSAKVQILASNGRVFPGVIGSTSVHDLTPDQRIKVREMKEIYVDAGFASREEVVKAGIEVGDQIVRTSVPMLLGDGDKYAAKAIDNRVGVAIIAKVIERLYKEKVQLSCQFFAVATAQEEVGLRGAKSATSKINPDVGIAIDVTPSRDTPGSDDTLKLGNGVAIIMKDNGVVANPRLGSQLNNLAKSKKIAAYKHVSASGGGNDSAELQFAVGGISAIAIELPTRYLHTSYEVGSVRDFESAVDLLFEFVKQFNSKTFNELLHK